MVDNILGRNKVFPIYNEDGTPFHDLALKKSTVDSVVMSLGDKITGDVYYKDTTLSVTMGEYIVYNDVKYTLVNPPTVVKEGMVSDNGDLNGMTKYSFVFYHPMYHLLNFPFTDVAVQVGQEKYLSQNKSFSWIGTLVDYVAKINKNLQGTQWICAISSNVPQEERTALSEVMAFDNATIADALKRGYETWEVPYIIDQIKEGETYYSQGKRFLIQFGLPSQEIIGTNNQPFVFQYGQGVGLKNHSRNPRNNKIITRIAGYGSEDNIPWGYPQIVWTGNQDWNYTVNNNPSASNSYPIYDGIVGGAKVKLIKHPFTRTHLMPSIYRDTVNRKVNPYASGYDPSIEIKDYYDADSTYTNPIVQDTPSYEIHEFDKIKPELGVSQIVNAVPYDGIVGNDEVLLADFRLKILERASSTSIDMERDALLGLYDNIVLPSSYAASGSQEAYNYQSSIGSATDDKRQVEFKSSNINFSEVVVVSNQTPSSSTGWIDDIDEDGNYIQSYFKITLPVLSFDLYASAALTQEMSINMRSGACIGCTFQVQVDWEDYRNNFYDAEGNFAPNGSQRNLDKYPKSDEQQITVIVQKDINTFGTIMPNIYQQPAAGDKYVILGISLPLSYISDAEERLDADMKQYMRDNNVYYFDYPLKFDEYFLAKNINILSQLRPNTIVRFQYNSEQLALYVKQLTIKYDNTPLPQYDITLTDDVEIVLNPVGQVSDDVSKLRMLIGQGGVGSGNATFDSNAPFVRKDIDDTTNNIIRILNGLQLGENFSTGLLGEGGIIRVDDDGKTYIEADKLYVRMKFYADTIEVRRFLHSGGNNIKSPAGINCTRVEYIDSNGNITSDPTEAVKYRCYFKATDNDKKITNDFVVGDLAFCGETNVDNGSLSQHRYWRAVVGRNAEGVTNENNEMWIDLSATDCETGSGIPIAQDDIIQLGNKTDTTRQGAIIEYVSGEDSPSYMIYQGINSYSLNGRNKLALGYNSSTNRAYLNVYGDFFFGNPTKDQQTNQYTGSYIKYDSNTGALDFKGTISATSTINGDSLENYIKAHQDKGWSQSEIESLIVDQTSQEFSDINTAIETLQNQADGAIETWFYNGAPTLSNAPASSWNTPELKEQHLGDLYYDNQSGYAYRFIKTGNTYSWNQLSDSAVIKALANAQTAQDTADGKRRVFVRQPLDTEEYDEGDFWVNATYPASGTKTYENDILRAVTHKAKNVSFNINHWTKASKYTDDSALEAFLGQNGAFEQYKDQVKTQIDGKAETWYQSTNPANNWTDTETRNLHIGDIWHNTSSSTVGGVESGRDAIWNGTAWVESDVPSAVYDKIDGKADIFVSKPTTYNVNDMWIIEEGLSANDMPSGCQHKDIVISSAKRTNSYQKADWSKKDRYTDDTNLDSFITQILTGSGATGDAALAGTAMNALKHALVDGEYYQNGGLVLANIMAVRHGQNVTAGINGHLEATETGTDWKGYGIAAWYGGAMIDHEANPTASDYAKSIDRFDGSGYRAGGNISWDAQGTVTIKNITTLSDSQNSNLLNELATFNSAFTFATSGQGSTTALSITPNVPFTSLSIVENNANRPVATQNWVSTNYLSKTDAQSTYLSKTDASNTYVSIAFFNRLFQAYKSETISDANKVSPNDVTTTISNLKLMVGTWTNEYLSALGLSSGSGGSGGASTLGGLTDVNTTGAQEGQVLTYSVVNNVGTWIPTTVSGGGGGAVDWSLITNKPTLSISNGVITIGSDTITPVTITGTQTISGTKTFSSTNTSFKNVLPSTTDTYSLGSSTQKWSSIYTTSVTTSTINGYTLAAACAKSVVTSIDSTASLPTSLAVKNFVEGKGYVTTDTKNTAGGDNTTSKIFLVGMTAQTSSNGTSRTYTNINCYASGGYLYSGGTKVLTSHQSLANYVTLDTEQVINARKYIYSSATDTPLQIKGSTNNDTWIGFRLSNDTIVGYFGVDSSKQPKFYDTSAHVILHDGNYSSTLDGRYVTLDTTQTISGAKTFSTTVRLSGCGIEDVSTAGLLMYHPAPNTWTGVDNTQWCVGSIDSQGVIRSNLSNLTHYCYNGSSGTSYTILDTRNCNLFVQALNNYYSSRPTSANIQLGNGTLVYFMATSSMTTGKPSSDSQILHLAWDNNGGWDSQIAVRNAGAGVQFRGQSSGTWGDWHTLIDERGGTMTGNLTFSNGKTIFFKDTDGTDRSVLNFSGNNNVNLGYGTYSLGTGTFIYGKTLVIRIGGTSATYNALVIDASKNASFSGNVTASGEVTALSDIRHKSPISDVNTSIADISKLPLYYFKWKYKDDDNMHIGTSAQAVQKLFPELVLGGEELSVNYGVLGTTLGILNARKLTKHEDDIKELKKETKALRKENKALKERIKILEARA